MKIYTKTGDKGVTSLFGGRRTPKDALRIEAYGTVDELNSALGIARSLKPQLEMDVILGRLQNDLFVLGADLATPTGKRPGTIHRIQNDHVSNLEHTIDKIDAQLHPLSTFILPGGSRLSAQLHLARTICRRAERYVVRLSRREKIGPLCIVYLNRLSDLLFELARFANQVDGGQETPWTASPKI